MVQTALREPCSPACPHAKPGAPAHNCAMRCLPGAMSTERLFDIYTKLLHNRMDQATLSSRAGIAMRCSHVRCRAAHLDIINTKPPIAKQHASSVHEDVFRLYVPAWPCTVVAVCGRVDLHIIKRATSSVYNVQPLPTAGIAPDFSFISINRRKRTYG